MERDLKARDTKKRDTAGFNLSHCLLESDVWDSAKTLVRQGAGGKGTRVAAYSEGRVEIEDAEESRQG